VAKRALIVIDVQNEYFDGALPISDPPPELGLTNIGRAMDAASAAGVPVIVVRHGDTDPEAPIFREGTHAGSCTRRSSGAHAII
jgi:nicotinamidase-related amidase